MVISISIGHNLLLTLWLMETEMAPNPRDPPFHCEKGRRRLQGGERGDGEREGSCWKSSPRKLYIQKTTQGLVPTTNKTSQIHGGICSWHVHNFLIFRIEVLFKEMIVMWMCRQATIKTKPVRRVQSDMFTNQGVKAISTFYHPTTQKVFVRVETVTITLTEL